MSSGQFRQRLPVDFHDQAVRLEIRIHPVERKAFLDVKFAVGILVEDDFGQQAVDFHHGDLAADLKIPVCADSVIFAGFELMILQPFFASSVYS